jgi:ligand-binding sensor domain-containing protein
MTGLCAQRCEVFGGIIVKQDTTAIRKFCFNCESADPYVSCLYDAGDKIWVGSFRGILLYDYTTEHFTPLRAKTSHGVKISSNVTRITRDKDGNIWVSTMEQGQPIFYHQHHTDKTHTGLLTHS